MVLSKVSFKAGCGMAWLIACTCVCIGVVCLSGCLSVWCLAFGVRLSYDSACTCTRHTTVHPGNEGRKEGRKERLTGWLAGWLVAWLVGWLVVWLSVCLSYCLSVCPLFLFATHSLTHSLVLTDWLACLFGWLDVCWCVLNSIMV